VDDHIKDLVEDVQDAAQDILQTWEKHCYANVSDSSRWHLTDAGRTLAHAGLTLSEPFKLLVPRDVPFATMLKFELMQSL
jgi:hypothetical protein